MIDADELVRLTSGTVVSPSFAKRARGVLPYDPDDPAEDQIRRGR